MAGNPNIPQGVLNRLRGSVVWNSFPSLNVTAPFLGKAGISFAPEGNTTVFIPTMTGAVTSQEPYLMFSMTIALLKTQSLADQYKQQWETSAQLGDGTVRPDSSTLSPFQLVNCAIETVGAMSFAGEDAGMSVTIRGYYLINQALWSA